MTKMSQNMPRGPSGFDCQAFHLTPFMKKTEGENSKLWPPTYIEHLLIGPQQADLQPSAFQKRMQKRETPKSSTETLSQIIQRERIGAQRQLGWHGKGENFELRNSEKAKKHKENLGFLGQPFWVVLSCIPKGNILPFKLSQIRFLWWKGETLRYFMNP